MYKYSTVDHNVLTSGVKESARLSCVGAQQRTGASNNIPPDLLCLGWLELEKKLKEIHLEFCVLWNIVNPNTEVVL